LAVQYEKGFLSVTFSRLVTGKRGIEKEGQGLRRLKYRQSPAVPAAAMQTAAGSGDCVSSGRGGGCACPNASGTSPLTSMESAFVAEIEISSVIEYRDG